MGDTDKENMRITRDVLRSSTPRDRADRREHTQAQLSARGTRLEVVRIEEAARLLERAIRAVQLVGSGTEELQAALNGLLNRHDATVGRLGGHITSRSRPAIQKNWRVEGPRKRFDLYVDESGGSRLNVTPEGKFFLLGGLLISQPAYSEFNEKWSEWKLHWVGNPRAKMHASSLGTRSIRYYTHRQGNPSEALSTLEQLIEQADLQLFVVAIDKEAFYRSYQREPVDAFLPESHYNICLDLLLERVVYCLLVDDDAHGNVYAESRNRAEDATLQLEYQRLQVEGTAFQAPTWFRYQLGPHITFHRKDDNVAGLQLIDILLKAVAEKLNAPSTDPLRWRVTRNKLYDKGQARIQGWGLKVFPHSDELFAAMLGEGHETRDAP